MKNFWNKQKKGFLALAPMAGITDSAFRQICADYGVDVFYSEMASATALNYNPEKTLELLKFSQKERPYVAQLFGNNPIHFAKATKMLSELKRSNRFKSGSNAIFARPDGIDINFGCPVPKVAKQGAGAELFRHLKLSREVIKAVIGNTNLPVSIKTRARVGDIDILKFLDYMKDLDIKAIMIHGRTKKEGFKGPIDTEIIRKSRNYFNGIIIANGGIYSKEDAENVQKKTSADGIGIAQGAMGKPWVFDQVKSRPFGFAQGANEKSSKEIFKIALRHAKLAEKLMGERGIIEMRKHLCWYVQCLPEACKMRKEFVRVKTIKDIKDVIKNF